MNGLPDHPCDECGWFDEGREVEQETSPAGKWRCPECLEWNRQATDLFRGTKSPPRPPTAAQIAEVSARVKEMCMQEVLLRRAPAPDGQERKTMVALADHGMSLLVLPCPKTAREQGAPLSYTFQLTDEVIDGKPVYDEVTE